MRKARNTIGAVLLALAVLATLLYIPVKAADSTQISVRTAVSKDGRYSDTAEFSVEDTVYLILHFSGIAGVGIQGIAFDVTYNAEALELSENTFAALADEEASFYKYKEGNRISILWDTLSTDTVFNNDVFYIAFKTKNVETDTDLPFSVTVKELYSSATGNPDIIHNAGTSLPRECMAVLRAGVISESFLEELLSAVDKLENITKDSLDDIVAAELLWKDTDFTSYQKQYFMENYPEKYTLLSTARTRYNQVLNQIKIDEINRLVEEFKTNYAEVLKLTTETVSPKDETDVLAAQTAYDVLPSSVTTRLDSGIPSLLEKLLNRIEELKDARKEAEAYIESYSYLTDVTDVMLDEAFELYSTAVDEAVMVYDILPPDAQLLVSNLYNKIMELKKKIDAKTAEDEAKAAVRAEVNAFQQKWLKVFTLNNGNVTTYDRTAIEMALADYETLSESAKTALVARITMLKNLLKVIEGAEQTGNSGTSNGEPGGTSDTPNGGKKDTVEKEITVIVKEFISKNMSKIIWGMFILLAVAVLALLIPLIMTVRYKKCIAAPKQQQKSEGKGEEA